MLTPSNNNDLHNKVIYLQLMISDEIPFYLEASKVLNPLFYFESMIMMIVLAIFIFYSSAFTDLFLWHHWNLIYEFVLRLKCYRCGQSRFASISILKSVILHQSEWWISHLKQVAQLQTDLWVLKCLANKVQTELIEKEFTQV